MLIGEIVAAVMVAAVTVALLTRRMVRDDVHSVQGYHRSIHTLESINAHPAVSESSLGTKFRYPESTLRVVGTPSVRVTDALPPAGPNVPSSLVTHPDVSLDGDGAGPPAPSVPVSVSISGEPVGHKDKAMGTMNRRPRRLAAPATAVAVVIVLVVVLLVTGSHSVTPQPRHKVGSSSKNSTAPVTHPGRKTDTTTTSTASPQIVLPQSGSTRGATYDVSGSTFTLAFSATSGACWVDAMNSSTGATLFAGTLQPGAQQLVNASGPVTVIVGAPAVLAVLVNGSPVGLPSGFLTPFTMKFVIAS